MSPGSPVNTLVVDDEEYFLELIEEMLELGGHNSMLASSGEEALKILEEHWNQIDLIILDWKMPGMDGMAFLERMREKGYGNKVLISSAFQDPRRHIDLDPFNVRGFIRKPYPPKDLLDVIQAVTSHQPSG